MPDRAGLGTTPPFVTRSDGAKFLIVQGYCPMGCGETLFLGEGGHVTCSWMECPNPSAADELLHEKVWLEDA